MGVGEEEKGQQGGRQDVQRKSSLRDHCSWYSEGMYDTHHPSSAPPIPHAPQSHQAPCSSDRARLSTLGLRCPRYHPSSCGTLTSVSLGLAWSTTKSPGIPEHQQFLPSPLSDNNPLLSHDPGQLPVCKVTEVRAILTLPLYQLPDE